MFTNNLPKLCGVIALAKGSAMRSFLAAALLPLMVIAGFQSPGSSNTYTLIGNEVVQHAKFTVSSGKIGNAPTRTWPGHDFGAIVDESNLDIYLPAVNPFFYTLFNGSIVKRNSELGPLTGILYNPHITLSRGPGHDFGVIGDNR